MKTHGFYAVEQSSEAETVAKPESKDAIPVPVGLEAASIGQGAARNRRLSVYYDGIKFTFARPRRAAEIVARIDGEDVLMPDLEPKIGIMDKVREIMGIRRNAYTHA